MKRMNRWVIGATHEQLLENVPAQEIAASLHLTLPTAALLCSRGYTTPSAARSFLTKETEQFHDPFALPDMKKAACRILESVEKREKIVIYGDYDVDGVTSVSSLLLYLRECGADVSYYIPNRVGEGYGMSPSSVQKLAEGGANLIVTVDTGITAVEEAKLVADAGMTLIITDHHECYQVLPDAYAIVNPKRPDCDYPFKELAGVGVVFKLLCALEALRHPELPLGRCVQRVGRAYGDLVAIGTVADVMPIRDENRLIVSYGLSVMEMDPRPGIIELLDATRTESRSTAKKKITAGLIGFTIAPRLNAAGRIRNAALAVDLFLSTDCETARPIAKELCDINKERQNEENKIVDEAREQIKNTDLQKDPVIVLGDETWHHGVIGIVSSRITERFNCPSILISFEGADNAHDPNDPNYGEAIGKGSGRSVKGMNLAEALGECADLLEKYGGHELAAGLTIKRKNLAAFCERINAYARERLKNIDPTPLIEAECELTPADITMKQAEELYCLEPYGVSNPQPVFYMKEIPLVDIAEVGGGKHTRLVLRVGNGTISAMCFRKTMAELDIFPGDILDIVFLLDINEFQGNKSVQLIVKDVRLTAGALGKENRESETYRVLLAGEADLPLNTGEIVAYIPTRDDCGVLYSLLRRELRLEHSVYSVRALQHLLRTRGRMFSYTKIMLMLRVLGELHLITMEPLAEFDAEVYALECPPAKEKTNLERSPLYKRLVERYFEQ